MSGRTIPTCWQPLRSNACTTTALLVALAVPMTAYAAPKSSVSTVNLDAPLTAKYQRPLRQKVAEEPAGLAPVQTPSSASGLVPGPATSSMPELKSSGSMSMPTTSTAPMPSGNTIAPASSGSTNPPSITPAAPVKLDQAPQKS